MKEKEIIEKLLQECDVEIGGHRPWDLQVHDDKMYSMIIHGGPMALGETYMSGMWKTNDESSLAEFFTRVLRADIELKIKKYYSSRVFLKNLPNHIFGVLRSIFKKAFAFNIGKEHYDIGNGLYKKMLGRRMIYSCAFWEGAQDLEQAQENKLDLICKKVKLRKGMKVLDIGCGWGSFLKYAAEKYGISGVGVTVSDEQRKLAMKTCTGHDIEIRLQDYRDIPEEEKYDAIVSVGMFEHVRPESYREFMKHAEKHLVEDGIFLLHSIGSIKSVKRTNPWIEKYIFPGGVLPSIAQIGSAVDDIFIIEDLHNFGVDYDLTLMNWYKNFKDNWLDIKDMDGGYSDRFYNMWVYYLLICAGSFRSRKNQLWQIALRKKHAIGGYKRVFGS